MSCTNLSDWKANIGDGVVYPESKVKEFIEKLTEGLYKDWCAGKIGLLYYQREIERIEKEAGPKLLGKDLVEVSP